MAKTKKSAKKKAARAGRTLAARTLAHPRARVKDKELAATVLSQGNQKKKKKK
jgi:hypothetical protein